MKNQLKAIRVQAGLKQSYVAGRLGISTPLLGFWENGRVDPKPEQIRRLAKVLEVHPKQLFTE